jgi:hypothetical protein
MTLGSRTTAAGAPSAILRPKFRTADAIAQAHHHFDVVFDDNDGEPAVAQAPDVVGKLAGLDGIHAGGGLVHQQQLRPRRQRARNLKLTDKPEGQFAREAVGMRREPRLLENAIDLLANRSLAQLPARAGDFAAGWTCRSD